YMSRDLEARNVGRARRRRIHTLALHDVGTVDAGGGHFDQYLSLTRLRHRAHAGLQHIRLAGFGDFDRRHGVGKIGHVAASLFRFTDCTSNPIAPDWQRETGDGRRRQSADGEKAGAEEFGATVDRGTRKLYRRTRERDYAGSRRHRGKTRAARRCRSIVQTEMTGASVVAER